MQRSCFQALENGGIFGFYFDATFASGAFCVELFDAPFGFERTKHSFHGRNLGFEMPRDLRERHRPALSEEL